jgi:hypothetical protein
VKKVRKIQKVGLSQILAVEENLIVDRQFDFFSAGDSGEGFECRRIDGLSQDPHVSTHERTIGGLRRKRSE